MHEIVNEEKHRTIVVRFDPIPVHGLTTIERPINQSQLRIQTVNGKLKEIQFLGDDKDMGDMSHMRNFTINVFDRSDLLEDFVALVVKANQELGLNYHGI